MLPQQPRNQTPQNASVPPFPTFTEPLFNLDSNAAAKQMAALNVVNMQRQLTNAYPRPPAPSPSQIPLGGTTPASFLGGISSPYNPSGSFQPAILDAPAAMQFSPHSTLQPAFLPVHTLQPNPPSLEPSSNVPPRHPPNVAMIRNKQRNFLVGLANVHLNRGTPLPSALTTVPCPPNYDLASSQWKNLECSPEVGAFRLAGKDVDLFKLWGIVWQLGGGQKVTQQNAWSQLLPHFDLPEYHLAPMPIGQRATSAILAHYYNAIIQPFEEVYRRNVQDTNRKAMMTTGRPPGAPVAPNNPPQTPSSALPGPSSQLSGSVNNMMGLLNQSVSGGQNTSVSITGSPTAPASQILPQSPHPQHGVPHTSLSGTHGFSDSLTGHSLVPPLSSSSSSGALTSSAGSEHHEQDAPGMKRRFESEELDGKRAKLKMASMDRSLPQNPTTSVAPPVSSRPRSQFTRTKIEYIPLAREVDTYGGRDLNILEDEYLRAQRRPMRDINEWGTVDIEALTMSIRCRLTVELSYALTTLTLLSTMKGPTPGSGFPIAQCTDLLEEVLDLLEEEAFDGVADTPHYCLTEDTHIPRHRELVTLALETESLPFAGLKCEQNFGKTGHGHRHRSSQVILAVTNIIRNLSVIPDNMQFMARHDRTLELVLRICGVIVPQEGGPPRPTSPALSIPDVINVRRDVLNILSNLSVLISFPQSTPPSDSTTRIYTRIFELVASILIEPADAIPPTQMLKLSGIPFHNCKPPSLSDVALDVFTHIAHLDHNRKTFSAVIPQQWLWRLLETLVYRLPVSDADFAFLSRESWLSYLEKATMAIYAIAFLSPPELKKKVKSDRSLHFSQIMLRMAQRFAATSASPEARQWFLSTARRAIEAMKAVDSGEDAFDTSQATQPTLAFGMGFGESGETKVEKGIGMLAGRRDAAWELLTQRDLDQTMFAELESLMRVE
ncbi:hypothetical protein J3R82DRAFT_927 [Butyriboletus roseoflavus]|nr:hypothetical protein J3R82DRAFT_927 [Butyriboletus roseoflavus]